MIRDQRQMTKQHFLTLTNQLRNMLGPYRGASLTKAQRQNLLENVNDYLVFFETTLKEVCDMEKSMVELLTVTEQAEYNTIDFYEELRRSFEL